VFRSLIFLEEALRTLRDQARIAKLAYDSAVTTRSTSQRDVNSLLERKHSWNDADVSAFTTLVRSDHNSTSAVSATSVQLKEAELSVDRAFTDLTRAILERYHEEQVWSDKIRNVSTYANLVGLAINLVVFIGAIAIVEPWKRRRLIERLEERIAGMMDNVDRGVGSLADRLDGLDTRLGQESRSTAAPPIMTHHPPSRPLDSPAMTYTSLLPKALAPTVDPYLAPSPERDIAVLGFAGAISGIGLITLLRLLLKGS
jgi:sensitive to high expression protein 9